MMKFRVHTLIFFDFSLCQLLSGKSSAAENQTLIVGLNHHVVFYYCWRLSDICGLISIAKLISDQCLNLLVTFDIIIVNFQMQWQKVILQRIPFLFSSYLTVLKRCQKYQWRAQETSRNICQNKTPKTEFMLCSLCHFCCEVGGHRSAARWWSFWWCLPAT